MDFSGGRREEGSKKNAAKKEVIRGWWLPSSSTWTNYNAAPCCWAGHRTKRCKFLRQALSHSTATRVVHRNTVLSAACSKPGFAVVTSPLAWPRTRTNSCPDGPLITRGRAEKVADIWKSDHWQFDTLRRAGNVCLCLRVFFQGEQVL